MQQRFGSRQIFLGVDADGVARRGCYVDVDAVVEQTELLEALEALDPGGRKRGKALQGGFAVGVDSQVLAIAGEALTVAVERDGCTREIEGAVVEGGDYLDGVGVVDLVRRTADGESGDLDFGTVEEREQRRKKVGGQSRLSSP